jgi:antitoxin FitA
MIAGGNVASITIPGLDDALKRKLRLRAAYRNHSMEDEARDILRAALAEENSSNGNLADAMRRRFEPLGGVELALPSRGPVREPPDFKRSSSIPEAWQPPIFNRDGDRRRERACRCVDFPTG